MPEDEVKEQVKRLDTLDKSQDKKISIVAGKEAELTTVYIAKVENLMSKVQQLKIDEDRKEKIYNKLAAKLFVINEKNIAEERVGFEHTIDAWMNQVEGTMGAQDKKEANEKEKEERLKRTRESELLMASKEMEMTEEIEKTLEPFKDYLSVEKADKGLEVKIKPSFLVLAPEKQMEMQKVLLSLQMKINLKKEEVLSANETREYVRKFYEANKLLNQGNYVAARNLYKQFVEECKNATDRKDYLDDADKGNFERALQSLKIIGEREINVAEERLNAIEKSVEVYSMNNFPEGKWGCSKAYAQKMVRAQKEVLTRVAAIIQGGEALTFQDAVESAKKGGYSAGIDDLSYFYFSDGGKNENYTFKQYYKREKAVPELDAIKAVVEEQGDLSPETIKKRAEEYKERGMYETAEKMYDLYFRNLYKNWAIGGLSRETFFENFKKDPEKSKKVDKMLANQEKIMEEKEGKVLSPQEREMLRNNMIEAEWKNTLRASITDNVRFMDRRGLSDNRLTPEIQQEWLKYNDDFLQTDRDWYEAWKFTAKEWDQFVETLPIDIISLIATAGISNAIGKGIATALAKKILREQLVKLGVREAFKELGVKGAMKVIASKVGGFAMESLVFSELNMLQAGFRTGDFSTIMNLEDSLKSWGHSALTLGTLRASGALGQSIKINPLVQSSLIDTAVLTSQNVALSAVSGEALSERDIASIIRSNVVLSLGISTGHRLANKVTGKIVHKVDWGKKDLELKMKEVGIKPDELDKLARIAYEKAKTEGYENVNTDIMRTRIEMNPEIGEKFDAHGITKVSMAYQLRALVNLLENGVDPNKNFHTAPLELKLENRGGGPNSSGAVASGDGSFIVLGAPGKPIAESGIKYVIVNDAYYSAMDAFKRGYPQVEFIRADQMAKRLAKITGLPEKPIENLTESKSSAEKTPEEKTILRLETEGWKYMRNTDPGTIEPHPDLGFIKSNTDAFEFKTMVYDTEKGEYVEKK